LITQPNRLIENLLLLWISVCNFGRLYWRHWHQCENPR